VTRYLVVIEGSGESYSGFAPDIPGCVAAGDSPDEVERLMKEAIPLHLESLAEHGEAVPAPETLVRYIAV
jgi:predicted RNase H-like HicB family nuclease